VITAEDVRAAASRLSGVAHRTPVVTSRTLDRRTGATVHLKAENLQRVGAFKFRGAYNALSLLPDDERGAGVFTFSSGNHAQAVALAARLLGVPATILMPEDAPPMKRAATRGYGAEVISYDRYTEDREALGEHLAAERGLVLVPPYDHEPVMAGQGTAAYELVDQAGPLDVVVTPIGGGGLLSGTAAVLAELLPDVRIVGVEPAERTVAREALATGQPVTRPIVRTIADGQQTPAIGHAPLAVLSAHGVEVVGVADADIAATMRWLFERMKLVVEPSGASALAAVLAGALDVRDQRVGIILSGGNIDAARFAEITSRNGAPPAN
jgi:threonine dehydratase